MNYLIISSSVIFAIIVSFYNAFFYKLYFTRDKSDNKVVHLLGGSLRAFWMLAIIAFCWFSGLSLGKIAFYVLINITLAWTCFDLIYNLIHNHKWYYSGTLGSGTSSSIDKILNKIDEYIKAGIIVLTSLWYPFNIDEMIAEMIANRWVEVLISITVFGLFGYIAIRFYNKKEKN